MTDSVQHYAAACTLNNMGVALMEGDCLSQARAAFQAASATMGVALPCKKSTPAQRQQLLCRTKMFLQDSLQRLANPEPMNCFELPADDSMDFDCNQNMTDSGTVDELHAVRVSANTADYDALIEPCTESACILYNYALSTWRLAHHCQKQAAIQLKTRALELWQMSSAVLQRNARTKKSAYTLDEQRQETVLHLAIMEGLYTVATDLGHEIPSAWLDQQTNLLMTLDALDELTAYSAANMITASAA